MVRFEPTKAHGAQSVASVLDPDFQFELSLRTFGRFVVICIYAGLNAMKAALEVHPPRREKQTQLIQLSFNPSLKVDFQGSRVTSDGGLILVRGLDERWCLASSSRNPGRILDSGKTPHCLGRTFCGSRSTAAWLATRTSTMPSGCRKIPPSGSSVQRRSGNAVRR